MQKTKTKAPQSNLKSSQSFDQSKHLHVMKPNKKKTTQYLITKKNTFIVNSDL